MPDHWLHYVKHRLGKPAWITPTEVARKLGIHPHRARRLAEWYALKHGKTLRDYMVKTGPVTHIYLLPPDFLEFVEENVAPKLQYNLNNSFNQKDEGILGKRRGVR